MKERSQFLLGSWYVLDLWTIQGLTPILIILKQNIFIDSLASESSDPCGVHLPSEKLPGLRSSPHLFRMMLRQELYKKHLEVGPFNGINQQD